MPNYRKIRGPKPLRPPCLRPEKTLVARLGRTFPTSSPRLLLTQQFLEPLSTTLRCCRQLYEPLTGSSCCSTANCNPCSFSHSDRIETQFSPHDLPSVDHLSPGLVNEGTSTIRFWVLHILCLRLTGEILMFTPISALHQDLRGCRSFARLLNSLHHRLSHLSIELPSQGVYWLCDHRPSSDMRSPHASSSSGSQLEPFGRTPASRPCLGRPSTIDLLLGVDKALVHGQRIGPPGSPMALETAFGGYWLEQPTSVIIPPILSHKCNSVTQ